MFGMRHRQVEKKTPYNVINYIGFVLDYVFAPREQHHKTGKMREKKRNKIEAYVH